MNNKNNANVDDIIAMLDGFMGKGGGHMNVSVDNTKTEKQVTTLGCMDCAAGNLACSVPTLHQGLDRDEDAE
ncbi:MAG: hypothetical protein ACI4C1_07460 [Lachnospiraceae bacterium]